MTYSFQSSSLQRRLEMAIEGLIYFDQTGGPAPAILKRFSVFFLAR